MCGILVSGAIGCINCFITPARFGMTPQIAGGPGIARVQESTNKVFPGTTFGCCTLKDVHLTVIDVLNLWERLKENVYRCVPVPLESS
jgi:hypothetical protein